MLIDSEIYLGNSLPEFSQEVIKNETMLFSASYDFAMAKCGEPTREFLKSLPEVWRDGIIDSRVHMLMPGWYPCIPGFHHDDVPRERSDGQPEYHKPSYRSRHAMCLYNGDICPTEFALGRAQFDDVELGQVYYREWHPIVETLVKSGKLTSVKAPSNKVIYFNDRAWHQGTMAIKNGWRLFIRISRNTTRPILNEIRRQVQVYMPAPMEGW